MTRRRALLARVESEPGIDTSPRILQSERFYGRDGNLNYSATDCASEIYTYNPVSSVRNIYSYGLTPYMVIFKDGGQTFMDWWSVSTGSTPSQAGRLNANSDGVGFSIAQSMIDVCYAYIVESGDIIFAGRNSIYYGHRNINELN